jgi:hypothetical protein
LPGGTRRRCYYLSGQTMLMLFDGFLTSVFDKCLLVARALVAAVFARNSQTDSFSFHLPPAARETKRQGKRSGYDRIQARELRQGVPRGEGVGRLGTCVSRSFWCFSRLESRAGVFIFPRLVPAGRREDQSTILDLHVRIIPCRAATTAWQGR